jgi:hypothetical protein
MTMRRRAAKKPVKRVARCPALEAAVSSVLGFMAEDDLKALYQRTTGVGHVQKGTMREKQIGKIVQLSAIGGRARLEAFLKQKAVGVGVLRKFLVQHARFAEAAAAKLRKVRCYVMLWRPFYPRCCSLRAQVVPSVIV